MISRITVKDTEVSLVHLSEFSPGFRFDIRYARLDNFCKRIVYPSTHAFLLLHVAQDLKAVHDELVPQGYGLLIFDAYRPWSVSKIFWDLSSDHDRQFLADPAKGSTHNRGCAVDLSLYDLKSGTAVAMPSDFDEMNERAYAAYQGGDEKSRSLRDLLQKTMKAHSFTGIKNEWWHFNHQSQNDWPVMDFSFSDILAAAKKE